MNNVTQVLGVYYHWSYHQIVFQKILPTYRIQEYFLFLVTFIPHYMYIDMCKDYHSEVSGQAVALTNCQELSTKALTDYGNKLK